MHDKKWHNYFRWFRLNQTLQWCSPDILKRFVINFMSVSEIDCPLLTIVVNKPFRIRCLSHIELTCIQGCWLCLEVTEKHIFFYWWSLSVRTNSMPRLGTDARHRAIGRVQAGHPSVMLLSSLVYTETPLVLFETFSDHRNWKWQTTVWASTCDVTEARPIHQVDALVQWLPDG